jgi:hypothetical protein
MRYPSYLQWLRKHLYLFALALVNSALISIPLLLQPAMFARAQAIPGDQQVLIAGNAVCASPPANFNPLTASRHDLLYYGLPLRPTGDSKSLNGWLTTVTNSKQRDCSFVTVHHAHPKQTTSFHPTNSIENYANTNTWSGYVEGSGSNPGFNYVKGEWNNPCMNTSGTPSGSQVANWVGLGGYSPGPGIDPGNLWQAGTEVETGSPAGGSPKSPVYHMWYEAYPKEDWQVDYQHTMKCGDQIYAEADYNVTYATTSYAYVHDMTSGLYITPFDVTWTPSLKYAEWIDERPSCPFTTAPHKLSDFNFMNWHDAYAKPTASASAGSINAFTHTQVTMSQDGSGDLLAFPTELNSDGASYTDYFNGNGVGSCGS